MLGLGQPGQRLAFHRSIERSINLTCWEGGTFATELAHLKTFHQTVGGPFATELAYLKTFHRWNGNWLTWVSHGKLHRKAGCQNRIEKGSFFLQRSRYWDFSRAKKPFRLMERDGTFSIGKTSNLDQLAPGVTGLPDGATFPGRPGSAENVPSNDGTFPSDLARPKTFRQTLGRSIERSIDLASERWNVFKRPDPFSSAIPPPKALRKVTIFRRGSPSKTPCP